MEIKAFVQEDVQKALTAPQRELVIYSKTETEVGLVLKQTPPQLMLNAKSLSIKLLSKEVVGMLRVVLLILSWQLRSETM